MIGNILYSYLAIILILFNNLKCFDSCYTIHLKSFIILNKLSSVHIILFDER